jgi:Glycosyl hydrolases family 39
MCALMTVTSCSRRETVSTPEPGRAKVEVNWEQVVAVSKTVPALQVVVNPPLRRGTKIHDRVFQALHDLEADYVRYVPWLPYPKLGVAELEPPKDGKTSWDLTLIDPMTEDFLNATAGHSVILNFSTIPEWMYKTEKPVPYPADPDQPVWDYEQGTQVRDPTFKEVADYYARLVGWYTAGGFMDEYGKRHDSGHHYKIDYWEVLNEVDSEHTMTPETYTRLYDAVVAAVHKVQPQMKFVGMALSFPSQSPRYFEYFLNPRNHKLGTPLDMISYHFYATPSPDETSETEQYTFFEQADQFITTVRFVEAIRQRLSPQTRTTVDEIGSIDSSDFDQKRPGYVYKDLPQSYWNLSGATYAYVYAELARLGIDVAGESQMVGYPTQFPSVSMVDWNTGQPNARYWMLKLLHDNLSPGDKLVDTASSLPYVYALGFVTRDGDHKLLLINKRNRSLEVSIPGGNGAEIAYVDQTTGLQPPAAARLSRDQATLQGLAVAIVTISK